MKRVLSRKKFRSTRLIAVVAAVVLLGVMMKLSSRASTQLPGDINNDNVVNISDLSLVLAAWNQAGGAADVNGNMVVDVFDLSIVLNNWGKTVSTPTPTVSSTPIATFTTSPTPSVIVTSTPSPSPSPSPTPVKTAIDLEYDAVNGPTLLGAPTGPETGGLVRGGRYRNYQKGSIVWSPASGAHVSMGAIRVAWSLTGFENGLYGYPMSDETQLSGGGGTFQWYEGGDFYWSAATGAHPVHGAISSEWDAVGGYTGVLGLPANDEIVSLKDGGSLQDFQHGKIGWSPKVGPHAVWGAILNSWVESNAQDGILGWPIEDPVSGLVNGGVYQNYEGGAIIWSPATGAFRSHGAIRTAWLNAGAENGALGYPTSNEYAVAGGTAQNFQHGVITWNGSSAVITLK